MKKSISVTELNKLASNHKLNKDLPFRTNWVAIMLDHLQEFINQAKDQHPECDVLKINFIRYSLNADDERILNVGGNLSQVSLIFVPGKKNDNDPWVVEVQKDNADNVLTLSVCEPGTLVSADPTGVCPPKGNE